MVKAGEATANFQHDINGFLDHWGLIGMATWDLPEPQGSLIPAVLPANSPAMPRHGLHIALPIHFPLIGAEDLLSEIQEEQVRLAKDCSLDSSIAGLRHHEVFSRMLDVHYFETTIRSHYGRQGQRGGFVTLLETAIAAGLQLDVESVQRLRKGISACIRGKRSSISWLRCPSDR